MISRRATLGFAAGFAACGIGLAAASVWMTDATGGSTSLIGGPFTLVDQDGRTVTDQTFRGEPFLVFFGYTHCPDVCPTTLADMTQVLGSLGPSKPARALFVSVDPERDTPAVLKSYLSSFDPRIVGLTGTPEQVAAAERAYRVYAQKAPTTNGDYTMDHTSIVYLMDKEGRFVQSLDLAQPPDKVAALLASYF